MFNLVLLTQHKNSVLCCLYSGVAAYFRDKVFGKGLKKILIIVSKSKEEQVQ